MIRIVTSHGDIVVELFEDAAPLSCENFRRYVEDGFFADTVFHRVIPNFMIQGGGMTEDMQRKKTRAAIRNEAANGKKNLRGTLAMARTGEVDSATSQFFINLRDNAFLDHRGRLRLRGVRPRDGGHGRRRRDRGCQDRQPVRAPGRAGDTGQDHRSTRRVVPRRSTVKMVPERCRITAVP